MRVVILTGLRRNLASLCLPDLAACDHVTVVRVILARGGNADRKLVWKRKLGKILRIGLPGALNGLRLRKWYQVDAPDIAEVCARHGIELVETDYANCTRTEELFRDAGADLGLSLGNGYIGSRIFTIPRLGMLNVHTEILPQFKGAQGVIWPIWEGLSETGFTVHEIDRQIDTGRILYQKKMPIQFKATLKQTVMQTNRAVFAEVVRGIVYVLENHAALMTVAKSNAGGKRYTTPSICQFIRMLWNHRKLAREACERRA